MPKYDYRSKAEAQFALWLTQQGIKFKYEQSKYSYQIKVRGGSCKGCGSREVVTTKTYTPDFWLTDYKFYVELKGRLTSKDRTKMLAVYSGNPGVDIRMVFLSDNKLSKGSETRYSDWATANGVTFHVGRTLPEGWLRKKPTRTRRKDG